MDLPMVVCHVVAARVVVHPVAESVHRAASDYRDAEKVVAADRRDQTWWRPSARIIRLVKVRGRIAHDVILLPYLPGTFGQWTSW
jgi:hypothetical protein